MALPDIKLEDFKKEIEGFSPVPQLVLPCPYVLVGSENDKYIEIEKLQYWANIIGADFVNVRDKGHMRTEAKLGEKEKGKNCLTNFASQFQLNNYLK